MGKDTSSPNLLPSSSFLAQSERASLASFLSARPRPSVEYVALCRADRSVAIAGKRGYVFSSRMSPGWNGEGGRKEGITGTTPLGKLLQARTLEHQSGWFVWTGTKIHLPLYVYFFGALSVDIVMEK